MFNTHQYIDQLASNILLLHDQIHNFFFGEQNLKKYQEESTNVSRVSVSLKYFFPLIIIFFPFLFYQVDFQSILIFYFGSFTGSISFGIF
jgi:hypothetical protein